MGTGRESDALSHVADFCDHHALVERGMLVAAAASGGPDSTALVDLLRRLAAIRRFRIEVVMIDHGLGNGFGEPVRLMRQRCRRWDIPIVVEKLHRKPGDSETSLRRARYEVFLELAAKRGWDRIATGHTRDDQVETLLLRILRGTGIRGLAGIPEVRDGLFIRPLLELRRSQLLDYLRHRRLRWWNDPANEKKSVPRNMVRNELLPMLRRRFNPSVDEALLRLKKSAQSFLELAAADAARVAGSKLEHSPGGIYCDAGELLRLPRASREMLVLEMASRLRGGHEGVLLERMEKLHGMIESGKTRFSVDLGGGTQFTRTGRRVSVSVGKPVARSFSLKLETGKNFVECPEAGWRIEYELVHGKVEPSSSDGRFEAVFDASGCSFPLLIRSMTTGDRIECWGGGTRRVSRIMIDAKIPGIDRWRIPLLFSGNRLLWIAGLRRSRHLPVKSSTSKVLVLRFAPDRYLTSLLQGTR